MTAIKIEKLTKKYNDTVAVNALDLSVNEGELFALLGVNGAGKTTLIKMLSCLIDATDGDAFIMGSSIRTDGREIKKIINVSPQETAVAPNLSVWENLVFISEIYGDTLAAAKQKAENMINKFALGAVRDKKAKKLSGGYQRRLSIAMALISEPKLLFLDEPTLGLDVLARRELWNIILQLKGSVTVILTTHYLEEAVALCDRIAIMSRGELKTVGTAEEIMQSVGADTFEDAFVKICGEGRI